MSCYLLSSTAADLCMSTTVSYTFNSTHGVAQRDELQLKVIKSSALRGTTQTVKGKELIAYLII